MNLKADFSTSIISKFSLRNAYSHKLVCVEVNHVIKGISKSRNKYKKERKKEEKTNTRYVNRGESENE